MPLIIRICEGSIWIHIETFFSKRVKYNTKWELEKSFSSSLRNSFFIKINPPSTGKKYIFFYTFENKILPKNYFSMKQTCHKFYIMEKWISRITFEKKNFKQKRKINHKRQNEEFNYLNIPFLKKRRIVVLSGVCVGVICYCGGLTALGVGGGGVLTAFGGGGGGVFVWGGLKALQFFLISPKFPARTWVLPNLIKASAKLFRKRFWSDAKRLTILALDPSNASSWSIFSIPFLNLICL